MTARPIPRCRPNDEFADYETWDVGNLDLTEAKTKDMLPREYAREALKNGLVLEKRLGTNPYKFGMIGSTDSHTGLTTAEEDNFFGKHSGGEPSPDRMLHPFTKTNFGEFAGWQTVASGRAAVWATENTREAIFDAMQAQGSLRHHRSAHDGAVLRRLGLYRPGSEKPAAGVSSVMRRACRWARI